MKFSTINVLTILPFSVYCRRLSNRHLDSSNQCEFDVSFQTKELNEEWCLDVPEDKRWPACYPLGIPSWHPHDNILVTLPDPSCDLGVSDTWTIAGWKYTLVQLNSEKIYVLPDVLEEGEVPYIKLLRGTVLDVNSNGVLRDDGRWESHVVTTPNTARTLAIDRGVKTIEAGSDGAVFVLISVPRKYLNTPVTSMAKSPATDISGPFSENLKWVQFGTYFPDPFEVVEFYNLAGILVNENDGNLLTYMQWWTLSEDMDTDGYHNHAGMFPNNTFAEVHMAVYTASGTSGMQTSLPNTNYDLTKPNPSTITKEDGNKYFENDSGFVQLGIAQPPGYVHGPLWMIDSKTGKPMYDCDGTVMYPFHRWLAGAGEHDTSGGTKKYHDPIRYSMWVAFEHPPQLATVPKQMINYWENAYVQSQTEEPKCGTRIDDIVDSIAELVGNIVEP